MPKMKKGEPEYEKITCAFCGGKGTDPFGQLSWKSYCVVCSGRGTVQMRKPHGKCPHCGASGAIKTFSCSACGWAGRIPLPEKAANRCPSCFGSGDDGSNAYLSCIQCRGRGVI